MTASPIHRPTTDLLTVEVSEPAPTARLTVVGEIDSSSAPLLREHIDTLLDSPLSELTIDLSGVTFLDSAGLCVLAAAHRRVGSDVPLRVLASSRAVIRPLQITGLWQLLHAEQVGETAGSTA
ncbi:STAS domain-containing protein [Blastococcus sp. CT_GayMR19]|uniref:STAS domain-containing protein n=1 Tax=Blastococcus sp. CT_GayMR19 TaxID=2559608 RepID=UPI0014302F53|nr:STAS domain-containing protein [Blastococcus sp. CT_GayMR19]